MPLSVREVLAHPSVAAADPVVRTGAGSLGRPVRWVHSSEVLDIGMLLRGGELLLTGGVVLAAADQASRRRYVRELAGRGVAGLAVEVGGELPEAPEELVAEAAALGLPLIELRRVVPFVGVCEAINGLLVNDSVQRLRTADALSHRLSSALATGSGPQELLDELARTLRCHAELRDDAGRLLYSTCADAGRPGELGDQPGSWSVPVAVAGTSAARLLVWPADGADRSVLDAALERAPEALGIALARVGAVAPEHHAVRELFRLIRSPDQQPERSVRLARAAGLADSVPAVGVVVRGPDVTGVGAVDAVLRQRGRRVLGSVTEGALLGLVVLSDGGRAGLLADLDRMLRPGRVRVGVGPTARGLDRLAHTVAECERCLDLADERARPEWIVDAELVGVELLLTRVGSDAVLRDFVADHLGGVLALGPARSQTLIGTLEAYLRNGCSKTETARELHLQRQTLYQRLGRIFDALGGDPTGTPRAASVLVAARLFVGGYVDDVGGGRGAWGGT